MTSLKEISKLNEGYPWDFFPNMMEIDIGDYTFTDMKRTSEFTFLYTNKDELNIALVFNEDRAAVILYILNEDGTVNATSWRLGKKVNRTFNREEFDNLFKEFDDYYKII